MAKENHLHHHDQQTRTQDHQSNQSQDQREEQQQQQKQKQTWGTWEELLLAFAVKRHGFKNWDSVAMELQTKTSLPHVLATAENCQQKYHDLSRRFSSSSSSSPATINQERDKKEDVSAEENTRSNTEIDNLNNNNNHRDDDEAEDDNDNDEDDEDDNKVVNIPWIEELRKLRVAELKQEVQRYDVSILSLQLKVKRLEEEREKSMKEEVEVDGEDGSQGRHPDLKQDRSEGDKREVQPQSSDHENRSVNESNSTGSGTKEDEEEDGEEKVDPAQAGSGEPWGPGLSDSVQSSASLGDGGGRNRNRKGRNRMGEAQDGGGGGGAASGDGGGGGSSDGVKRGDGAAAAADAISEPLTGLLEMIRAHKNASLFEGRLKTQETDEYKQLIKEHLDLETIQERMEGGSYSASDLSFHRDLLLLFNNSIVFFPKESTESQAAQELRSLVSNEMKKDTQKSESTVVLAPEPQPPQPKTEPDRADSLLAKQKASAPIIFCRRRSSMSGKPASSTSGQKAELQQQQQQQQEQQKQQEQQEESNEKKPASDVKPPVVEQSLLKIEPKEKPRTGVRSSRRGNKNPTKITTDPSKKQNGNSGEKVTPAEKPEPQKTDNKRKAEASASASGKKQGAADFLKRMKKNPPVETPKKNTKGGSNGGKESKKDNGRKGDNVKDRPSRQNSNKKQAKKESSPPKRSGGRQPKKVAETSRTAGKRGREGGGKEATKGPRKRARR